MLSLFECVGLLFVGSQATEGHEHDVDDQQRAKCADAPMAEAVSVATEATLKPPSRKMINRMTGIGPMAMGVAFT